jgi:hypothetical protein
MTKRVAERILIATRLAYENFLSMKASVASVGGRGRLVERHLALAAI